MDDLVELVKAELNKQKKKSTQKTYKKMILTIFKEY